MPSTRANFTELIGQSVQAGPTHNIQETKKEHCCEYVVHLRIWVSRVLFNEMLVLPKSRNDNRVRESSM